MQSSDTEPNIPANGSAPQTQAAASGLAPSSYALAIVPSMITSKTVKINMSRQIKGTLTVSDALTNSPILNVVKEDSLFHATKTIHDMNGNVLFQVKERQSTDDTRLYVKDTNEERILQAGKVVQGYVLATFKNRAEGAQKNIEETLYIAALSSWAGDGVVPIKNRKNNECVALVNHEGLDYQVIVAPGVDISLIVAICIAFDYKSKEDAKDEEDAKEVSEGLEFFNSVNTLLGGN